MASKLSTKPAFVHVGSKVFPFVSFEETSRAYLETCQKTGATMSGATGPKALDCEILDAHGRTVAHVSYNGKVWNGPAWISGAIPLFNPYA